VATRIQRAPLLKVSPKISREKGHARTGVLQFCLTAEAAKLAHDGTARAIRASLLLESGIK
jgi:hypothetical protein